MTNSVNNCGEGRHLTGEQVRALCRAGRWDRPTAGAARGFVQANLVILPADWAADFESFCRLNSRACPLLEITPPGVYEAKRTAPGSDLRTDLPRYRVFRAGECVDRPASIAGYWRDDLVAFLLGCSFTFETALIEAGLPVRHIEQRCNVPMYRTIIGCRPAEAFSGPLVVSMRPMTPAQARLAAKITAVFPDVHGPPIHVGDPSALGISELTRPDYGDPVTIRPDEVPVFWACGVTPMEALARARPPLAITHDPGHMLVTDWKDAALKKAADAPDAGPAFQALTSGAADQRRKEPAKDATDADPRP